MKLKKFLSVGLVSVMMLTTVGCGASNDTSGSGSTSDAEASAETNSGDSDTDVWDEELYQEIVKTVNKNMPSFDDYDEYTITDSEYEKYIKEITEEYYTHEDQDYLFGLGEELKDFLKADAKEDKTYTSKSLTRNTQEVTYYGEAIQAAIDEATENGGGTVVVPGNGDEGNPIVYYTGALELKSNVELEIEKGATLKFVRNKSNDYYPVVYTRWEGVEMMNYSPFIYAYEAENIAITGEGVLDGQADEFNWMPWKYGYFNEANQADERNRLFELGQNGAEVEDRIFTDETSTLRPPFIQPYKSTNILIEGITIKNSPFWEVNPVLCENVKVDGITIDTNLYNNDGVDPESSKNVLIENSSFNTGDDCIAIKSGRNNDGRRVNVPSENIVVRNNSFANGHGGITVGSEISGSVKNVLATDNYFDSEELDYPIRFKTNAERGGVIENIYITNSTVKKSKKAVIHCDFFYEEGEDGDHTPTLRNVYLSNIKTVDGASIDATNTLYLKGFENSPIENIVLQDVELNGTKGGAELQNVKGLTYKNVTIDGEKLEDKTIDVDNEGNES